MAIINPNTYVKLVHTELTPEHQLTFSNQIAQKNYFDNLEGLVLEDFTYQRKDNIIRYPQEFDKVEKYNYAIYCNQDYDNKYYYAYITDLKYINDNMTEIKIETDVFQTWQFDFIYKKSFVERKHVTDDIAGNYTLSEPVATGEYIMNRYDYTDFFNEHYYLVQVTKNLDGVEGGASDFGGIFMTGFTYVCDSYAGVMELLLDYKQAEISTKSITNVYIVPSFLVPYDTPEEDSYTTFTSFNEPVVRPTFVAKATALDRLYSKK